MTNEKNYRYIDREKSWLAFNARVLQEAGDESVPLLDRLRFLGIFSNNLDEFFRVRFAAIRRLSQSGVSGENGSALQVGGAIKHGSHLPCTVTGPPRIIATQMQRGKRVGCKESGCWMPCRSICAVMDGPFRVENTRCGRGGICSARRSVIALTSTLSTRW